MHLKNILKGPELHNEYTNFQSQNAMIHSFTDVLLEKIVR